MMATAQGYRNEFAELENTAMQSLQRPGTIAGYEALRSFRLELLLWHYPAFGDYRSWGIFKNGKPVASASPGLVREITWKRPADYERFQNPLVGLAKGLSTSPTIEVTEAPLAIDAYEQIFARLSNLAVQVWPDPKTCPFGTDGEVFGIQFGELFNWSKFEWWLDGPPAWKQLVDWASETRILLTKTCAAITPQILYSPKSAN